MNFPIGRNKVRLNVAMIRPTSQIRVAIILCGVNAKLYFRLLQAQRQEIERDFGHPLEWHEMPDGQEAGSPTTLTMSMLRTAQIGRVSIDG